MNKNIITSNHISFSLQTDMLQICQPILTYPIIKHFSWLRLYNDGYFQFLMCNPQLGEHHINSNYVIVPNVDLKLIKEKFYYFALTQLNDQYEQALYDYKNIFDIHHPIFFFEQYQDYYEILVFSTGEDDPAVFNFYLNNLSILENFILSFKEKACPLIQKAQAHKVYLPEYMRADNFFMEQKLNHTEKQCLINFNGCDIKFSKRQMEVLRWLRFGHTCKEIAKIMDLSPRTIEEYIDNIKKKLNLNSKHALIQSILKQNILIS